MSGCSIGLMRCWRLPCSTTTRSSRPCAPASAAMSSRAPNNDRSTRRSWPWPPGGPSSAPRSPPGADLLRYPIGHPDPRSPNSPPESVRSRNCWPLVSHNHHQIAEGLSLSVKMVVNHLSVIFAKLQVADHSQAILCAPTPARATPDQTRWHRPGNSKSAERPWQLP